MKAEDLFTGIEEVQEVEPTLAELDQNLNYIGRYPVYARQIARGILLPAVGLATVLFTPVIGVFLLVVSFIVILASAVQIVRHGPVDGALDVWTLLGLLGGFTLGGILLAGAVLVQFVIGIQ